MNRMMKSTCRITLASDLIIGVFGYKYWRVSHPANQVVAAGIVEGVKQPDDESHDEIDVQDYAGFRSDHRRLRLQVLASISPSQSGRSCGDRRRRETAGR